MGKPVTLRLLSKGAVVSIPLDQILQQRALDLRPAHELRQIPIQQVDRRAR